MYSHRGTKWRVLFEERQVDCCNYRAQLLGTWNPDEDGQVVRVGGGRAREAPEDGAELLTVTTKGLLWSDLLYEKIALK